MDNNLDAVESFISFIQMENQTGAAISQAIHDQLALLGVDLNKVVGQAYDGAAAMSGKKMARGHWHVHCFSNCLNLVTGAANEISEIRAAYTTISDACNFFKSLLQLTEALEKLVTDMRPQSNHTWLKSFCPTRWVERHE